ncbi:hypothetical protein BASA60_007861 [Batrachochytrium salamandrivorans]|nr:hypothetical protein BASA60_007861 [Batrachochytrium salamandrivorans]
MADQLHSNVNANRQSLPLQTLPPSIPLPPRPGLINSPHQAQQQGSLQQQHPNTEGEPGSIIQPESEDGPHAALGSDHAHGQTKAPKARPESVQQQLNQNEHSSCDEQHPLPLAVASDGSTEQPDSQLDSQSNSQSAETAQSDGVDTMVSRADTMVSRADAMRAATAATAAAHAATAAAAVATAAAMAATTAATAVTSASVVSVKRECSVPDTDQHLGQQPQSVHPSSVNIEQLDAVSDTVFDPSAHSMANVTMSLMSLTQQDQYTDDTEDRLAASYGGRGSVLAGGSGVNLSGRTSVASMVSGPATLMARTAHTEKMASILKKSEVLKEMEEDSRRKRAISHRSIDFLGVRNMRRSRDLLDDGPQTPLPASAAWGESQSNQRSGMGSLGRPGQLQPDYVSGTAGRTDVLSDKPLSMTRSASGSDSLLIQKFFKNTTGSSGASSAAMDASGANGPATSSSGGSGASGDPSRHSPLGDAPATPGSASSSASASALVMPNSFTALNVTALRKNRMSTLAGGTSTAAILPNPPVQAPLKSANTSKTFKEWYTSVLSESDASTSTHTKLSTQATGSIELQTIFGKKGDDINPVERLLWVAKEYDSWRRDPQWIIPGGKMTSKDFAQEDMAVRLLDIIPDGRIPGLVYDEAISDGDLDIVILGTCKDLMDGLIFPLDQDMSFAEVFLASYRFFMPAQELLDSLIGWYNADAEEMRLTGSEAFLRKNRKHIQTRAVRVLLTWILSFGNNQKLTQAIREQRLSWYTYQYIPMFPGARASGQEKTRPWISEWDIDDLAQNLTMIDHLFFRQMKPDMYLQILHTPAQVQGGGFSVPLKAIMDLCHWFRTVVGYTATVIAKESNIKKKTNYIKRFIKVAKACKELANFNTMFAIIYGLKRPAVLMWTQAWEGLPSKYIDLFKELDRITDPANGHFNYTDEVTQRDPPAVPFMLPYIQDMIQTHCGTPISLDGEAFEPKRINFQKYYHIYSIAAELEVLRLASYYGKLKGDRESNMLLVSHMRSYTMLDAKSLGEGLVFSSTGSRTDWSETASGSSGSKQ